MDAFLNILVENLNHWHQNPQRARKNIAGTQITRPAMQHNPKVISVKSHSENCHFSGGGAPLLQYFGFLHPSDTLWLLFWNKSWGFICYLLLQGIMSYSISCSTSKIYFYIYFTNQECSILENFHNVIVIHFFLFFIIILIWNIF